MNTNRRSGVLLHVTSLPSVYGIGDFGPSAYDFANFLCDAGQSIWQILPLNPTSDVCGNSPYCSYSAFAGNPLLISLELLVEDGLLHGSDVEVRPQFRSEKVEFEAVTQYKKQLLWTAFERFKSEPVRRFDFDVFYEQNKDWLDDYALFVSLKERFGGVAWSEWPIGERDRNEHALSFWRDELKDRILFEQFLQYLFFKQWLSLKTYCNKKNIQIMGDIPIYVSFDSADVWANPVFFKLDENKRPALVAGVPPDYFSATGQLWGNPVYDWYALRERRYSFWLKRMEHNLKHFDLVRLDHFRGFVGYWEVPATETTAINGEWVEAPAREFFNTLLKRFPYLPIIAEDLGTITPDVREIMISYEFPGMKLLHFAFGDDLPTNPYIPHNHSINSVVYPGTHDNNTTKGWFRKELGDQERERLFQYLGRVVHEDEVHLEITRLALMSICNTAIIPMQDILGLGEEARMNLPSVAHGNWEWRLEAQHLSPTLAEKWLRMTRLYGRA
jgi:4-alpha-glucanotransferase